MISYNTYSPNLIGVTTKLPITPFEEDISLYRKRCSKIFIHGKFNGPSDYYIESTRKHNIGLIKVNHYSILTKDK